MDHLNNVHFRLIVRLSIRLDELGSLFKQISGLFWVSHDHQQITHTILLIDGSTGRWYVAAQAQSNP